MRRYLVGERPAVGADLLDHVTLLCANNPNQFAGSELRIQHGGHLPVEGRQPRRPSSALTPGWA